MQIYLFVLNAPPEPFHEYVIPPAIFAIHADGEMVLLQKSRKLLASELTALVGVEDFWRTIACNHVLHGFYAEIGRQRIGQPPRQYPATRPVHGRTQVREATHHRDVRVE